MMILTTENTPMPYQWKGFVNSVSVYSVFVARDILAGLKNLKGGKISEFEDMIQSAIDDATETIKSKAVELDADAIIGFRLQSTMVGEGCAEIIAYGTAVKLIRPEVDQIIEG